jgi:hypothetical protein
MEKKMSEKKPEPELRITFTTMAFNVSSVLTSIQEEAFKRSLPCSSDKIGGLFEQTWGVKITGKKADIDAFEKWFNENADKLCDTSFSRMMKGM